MCIRDSIRGGYAMALINEEALYAFRDPHGVRPLVLGRLTNDEGVAAADELHRLANALAQMMRLLGEVADELEGDLGIGARCV